MSQDRPGPSRRYRDALCQAVIVYMGQGYSLTAFAGEIGLSRAKLDEWIADHPPFAEAVARGRAARTRALEAGLLKADSGARVSAHRLALRTVRSDDWSDHAERGEAAARPASAALELPDNARD